jgi:SAM-dependent methyltransferase
MKKPALFHNHLTFAHFLWQQLLNLGDSVLDATCGNGHDTLFLAQKVLDADRGSVHAIDMQSRALQATKLRLESSLPAPLLKRVHYWQQSHAAFPSQIAPRSLRLVVYNLGYLPGGDHSLTTKTESTLASIQSALPLIQPGGALSITCYPGHSEGAVEESAIATFVTTLDRDQWSCSHHHWPQRTKGASLFFLQQSVGRLGDAQSGARLGHDVKCTADGNDLIA